MKTKSLKLNFILNTTRTILNFLVPLMTFPYVSRILGPIGLGNVEFANSVVSYFVLFTGLGISVYGMREIARIRDDEELRSRTVWELSFILLFTVTVGYIIYFLLIHFIPTFNNQKLLFFIVAPTIFLTNFSFEWFYQGIENQIYITIRYIFIKLLQIACVFLLIHAPEHFYRYAIITVGLNSISTIFNIIHLRKFIHYVSIKNAHSFRHFKPAIIIFASTVAVNIYMHLDVTMTGFICGEEKVGLYTAANRLIRIVISLVTALSAVVVPRLENCLKKDDEESYKKYLNISLHYILILSIPCCLGIVALAPDIISIFAGRKYSDSINTIRLLSPIIILVPLANFTGMQILFPRRLEWKYTISVSIAAVANALSNTLLIPIFAQNGAALGTVVAEALGLLLQLIFARHFLYNTDLFSFNTLKYLIAGGIMFIIVLIIPDFSEHIVVHCIISIIIAIILYCILLIIMKEKLMVEILRRMRKL